MISSQATEGRNTKRRGRASATRPSPGPPMSQMQTITIKKLIRRIGRAMGAPTMGSVKPHKVGAQAATQEAASWGVWAREVVGSRLLTQEMLDISLPPRGKLRETHIKMSQHTWLSPNTQPGLGMKSQKRQPEIRGILRTNMADSKLRPKVSSHLQGLTPSTLRPLLHPPMCLPTKTGSLSTHLPATIQPAISLQTILPPATLLSPPSTPRTTISTKATTMTVLGWIKPRSTNRGWLCRAWAPNRRNLSYPRNYREETSMSPSTATQKSKNRRKCSRNSNVTKEEDEFSD